MIGTQILTGDIQRRLTDAESLFSEMRAWGPQRREEFARHFHRGSGPRLSHTIQFLRRCDELSRQFRVVVRDETVKRAVSVKADYNRRIEGGTIDIPLVFWARLPLKPVSEMSIYIDKGRERTEFKVRAQTPIPTAEAMTAIKQHGDLFDELQLWWVPNEILVEQLPPTQLDPILVGVAKHHGKYIHDSFCFELHRWVDEACEIAWWSKEGY